MPLPIVCLRALAFSQGNEDDRIRSKIKLESIWDVLRVPHVREVIHQLGYPSYFLIILGIWKLLGAVALAIPRFPRLKEWTYAGVIFNFTGAIASHCIAGVD